MGKLIVVQTNVAQIDFQLMLLQQQVPSQFVSKHAEYGQ
jgi:hypothetical protein